MFQLLERVVRSSDGRKARGFKRVQKDEDYLRDHYPGYPLVPGVLLIDAMAQLGAFVVDASVRSRSGRRVLPVLVQVEEARFLRRVRPGDYLEVSAAIGTLGSAAALTSNAVEVDGRRVAAATLMYALLEMTESSMGVSASQIVALRSFWDRMWESDAG